ncbi:hypothetical protein CJD36_014075 [Flavipsychrobacter stenotrophus]|uniref:Uncharacterized protein n=2 Tax=Flavipsychrobacter stenotrophus TaxID=2077091 RepID=A0A2S7SWU7_9BACT|nr:hypothetical protein CJD36_014075 [Flavipsychrobacter stenotrophus]
MVVDYVNSPDHRVLPVVIFAASITIACIILFWLPLKRKAVKIVISDDTIIVSSFLGIGPKHEFLLSAFTGFVYFDDNYQNYSFQRLYLLINQQKVVGLSGFYHKNYNELKQTLSQKVPDHGVTIYNFSDELIDAFL